MLEYLILLVFALLAWARLHHLRPLVLLRALLLRPDLQAAGLLLLGAFFYLVAKHYPRYLHFTLREAHQHLPDDLREDLAPVYSLAQRWRAAPAANPLATARRVSESLKKQVAAAQAWHCAHCRAILPPTYEIDHILRLEYGGSNLPDNLQALCPNCHRLKTIRE